MKPYPTKPILWGTAAFLFLFFSCVKDVDFDQTDDILLTPEVDLDLVFFNLNTSNFVDVETQNPIDVIRDTTRLEFLDDDYVQENLKKIEFTFKYDNSFSQMFTHKASFVNDANEIKYEINFEVSAGGNGAFQTTDVIREVAGADLDAIRSAIKLIIELTLQPNTSPIEGELKHQSKAKYALEFADI